MKIICYDIGSYSLKRVDYFVEKKLAQEVHHQEFPLVQSLEANNEPPDIPIEENDSEKTEIETAPLSEEASFDWVDQVIQILISEQSSWQKEDKVFLVLPEDYSTSRYINLPVSSPKKASQILPFQLEDSIPFAMDKIIYKEQFNSSKSSTDALINIIDKEDFENLYNELEKNKIYFDHITTNFGIVSALSTKVDILNQHLEVVNFAILDIGHMGSSCFFFDQGQLVSNHNSIASGYMLTENLADSYNISHEEAVTYKHDESFFLTEDQMEQSSEDEKVFALFMERTFSNLITDFSRWNLGHRTKTNRSIDHLYITGGSSKIQNIENFLEEKLEIPCSILKSKHFGNSVKNNHSLVSLLPIIQKEKCRTINFLGAKYKARKSSVVPLSSSLKLFSKTAVVSSVICFFIFIDLFLNIYSSSKYEKKYLNTLIKNKIGITKRQVPTFRKIPKRLEPVLQKKLKSIQDSVDLFSGSNQHEIIKFLDVISKITANNGFHIVSLSISDVIGLKLKNVSDFESTKKDFSQVFKIDSEEFNDGNLEFKLSKK